MLPALKFDEFGLAGEMDFARSNLSESPSDPVPFALCRLRGFNQLL